MQNLISKLKELNAQIELETRFDYIINNTDQFLTSEEKSSLDQKVSNYYKNIHLKAILKTKYDNPELDNTLIDFWIINQWGGIKSFKSNERNIAKITTFKNQLKKKKLSKDTFGTISSLSKVASFMNPDEMVIYDSRVIFTLNWLILTTENQHKFNTPYFPMPSGRNKILTDFDMNTVINLFHIDAYIKEEQLFRPYQTAYFEYCDWIKIHTQVIMGKEAIPYQLEMLLFTLADKEIFDEIKNRIKIEVSKNE